VTDRATTARLTELQKRLTEATPAPLDGQQTIPVPEPAGTPETAVTRPSPPVQPPLW
jgi:hypothetical protein